MINGAVHSYTAIFHGQSEWHYVLNIDHVMNDIIWAHYPLVTTHRSYFSPFGYMIFMILKHRTDVLCMFVFMNNIYVLVIAGFLTLRMPGVILLSPQASSGGSTAFLTGTLDGVERMMILKLGNDHEVISILCVSHLHRHLRRSRRLKDCLKLFGVKSSFNIQQKIAQIISSSSETEVI